MSPNHSPAQMGLHTFPRVACISAMPCVAHISRGDIGDRLERRCTTLKLPSQEGETDVGLLPIVLAIGALP